MHERGMCMRIVRVHEHCTAGNALPKQPGWTHKNPSLVAAGLILTYLSAGNEIGSLDNPIDVEDYHIDETTSDVDVNRCVISLGQGWERCLLDGRGFSAYS